MSGVCATAGSRGSLQAVRVFANHVLQAVANVLLKRRHTCLAQCSYATSKRKSVWFCNLHVLTKSHPCIHAQVLLPTSQFIRSLVAARLAADVCGVPTVLIARTDAHSANLLTADVDERDRAFVHGERTPEGFHQYNGGIKVRGGSGLHCTGRTVDFP